MPTKNKEKLKIKNKKSVLTFYKFSKPLVAKMQIGKSLPDTRLNRACLILRMCAKLGLIIKFVVKFNDQSHSILEYST